MEETLAPDSKRGGDWHRLLHDQPREPSAPHEPPGTKGQTLWDSETGESTEADGRLLTGGAKGTGVTADWKVL